MTHTTIAQTTAKEVAIILRERVTAQKKPFMDLSNKKLKAGLKNIILFILGFK